jgi:NTP pyrophosphatase (non-canonical NTP hydrolase)
MQDDRDTTVWQLRQEMAHFVSERDWDQFHDPKNLAMSIAIEAAELMEHFQWLTSRQACDAVKVPDQIDRIEGELADILCFVLSFANRCQIDITQALRRKMDANRAKYPIDRFKGKFR